MYKFQGQNLNDNNLEKNNQDFNQALNIYENDYSHEDLIYFLKNGSVAQKQAAALKLDCLNSENDAQILMSNLTNCDGKIREAVSFRLNEFLSAHSEYFVNFSDIFLDAIIDINGNICRNTISALKYMKKYPDFAACFCKKLTFNTLELARKAEKFDVQDGKYKVNKEIFKLYWYLEMIYEYCDYISHETIADILFLAKNVHDYTIREKVAKILSKVNSGYFDKIREELSKDENYYVRRF